MEEDAAELNVERKRMSLEAEELKLQMHCSTCNVSLVRNETSLHEADSRLIMDKYWHQKHKGAELYHKCLEIIEHCNEVLHENEVIKEEIQ